MSLIDDLNNLDIFTASQQLVVDYLKYHPERITMMTIDELAKETYSSKTTIIRICKLLGFKGFRDFKIELTRIIESSKYLNNTIDFTILFHEDESSLQIVNNMANVYKNTIDLINSEINIDILDKIVDLLISSNQVFIFATGDSEITALNFINKCIKIGKFFHNTNQYGEQSYYAKNVKKDDCALFITYDKNDYYNECARHIIKNGAKMIVISAEKDSFLMRYCNYKIFIPHQESSIDKIATFYSQQGFQYVLGVVFALMYNKLKNRR